jgi:hypothetical protein
MRLLLIWLFVKAGYNVRGLRRRGRIVTGKTSQSHPEFYKILYNCLQPIDNKPENTEASIALS